MSAKLEKNLAEGLDTFCDIREKKSTIEREASANIRTRFACDRQAIRTANNRQSGWNGERWKANANLLPMSCCFAIDVAVEASDLQSRFAEDPRNK